MDPCEKVLKQKMSITLLWKIPTSYSTKYSVIIETCQHMDFLTELYML